MTPREVARFQRAYDHAAKEFGIEVKPPDDYEAFLERRAQRGAMHGFDPLWMPDFLYPFQRALVDWACRKGRSAIFADCGLGKTPMQLVWAENVYRKTGKPVLILTPAPRLGQRWRRPQAVCHLPDIFSAV